MQSGWRLRDLLKVASLSYHGGRGGWGDQKDFYDSMPCVGLALALVRVGAGKDENHPDIAGARQAVAEYVRRLQRVEEALGRLESGDAEALMQEAREADVDEG